MTPELLIAILTSLGLGTVIPAVVTGFLNRRAASEQARMELQKAQTESAGDLAQAKVDDAAKMRLELWDQLKYANARADEQSKQLGALQKENATLVAENETLKRQNTDLIGRLTTEQQKTEEANYRMRQLDQTLTDVNRSHDGAQDLITQLQARIDFLEREVIKSKTEPATIILPAGTTLEEPSL